MKGILYVVATPIGNLQDITIRAVETLKDVDIVVAENRLHSMKLLSHLGISKHIIGINSYNEDRKCREIIRHLNMGKSCALITSAGTPCISDPGSRVVRACHNSGIAVRVVPGPSAPTCALSVSGLFADRFLFYGFLPQKKGKKLKIIGELSSLPYPAVFFESPRRLIETLYCIKEGFGDRQVVILKEMTKLHEEVVRGQVDDIIDYFTDSEIKGEYVIIVDGRGR